MAGYSINRIPESQRIFLPELPNLWVSTGSGTPSPSSVEKYPGEGSIEHTLSVGNRISYNVGSSGTNGLSSVTQTTSLDAGDSISGFVWIRTDKPVIVNFSVLLLYPSSISSASALSSKSRSISVTSGEWTLLRLNDLPVVENDAYDYQIGMRVTIESIEGSASTKVNLSHPIIYGTLDFVNNPVIIDLMSRFPEFIRDQDANAQPFPYQFIRFIEMASIHTGEIADLANTFTYQDISEGKNESDVNTLSQLVDPTAAKREYLAWLAQFSGTQIINPTTGFTPWANLPATWQGIDMIDSTDTSEDGAPWKMIQDYNTEPVGLESFLRWQASTGYYGINSGTKESIIEAVKRVLIGTKSVTYEIASPFSWTIKVKTVREETPDSALIPPGFPVPAIIELLEPCRPLGFRVVHEIL